MSHIYILCTVLFTVYGQIIMKWRISKYGEFPLNNFDKIIFLVKVVFDPYIFSGLISAFIASLFWIAAITKLELSYAYPFVGLTYVFIFILSSVIFNESITIYKLVGVIFIILGIFISSRSV